MHIIGGIYHKYHFCRDKTTMCLSRQAYFVKTNTCLSRQNYTCLSRQAYFCQDKPKFVATKRVFCRDKSMLVDTKLLSRQTRDNTFVATTHKHTFVATKDLFVVTKKKKKIVAAPALSIHSFTAPAVVSRFGLAVRR